MIPPLTKWINDIKVKLGFSRTMTAAGADVVDAVNKHSDQIGDLTDLDTTNDYNLVAAINELHSVQNNHTFTNVNVNSSLVSNYSWEPLAYCRIGSLVCIHGGIVWNGNTNVNDVVFASGLPRPRQNTSLILVTDQQDFVVAKMMVKNSGELSMSGKSLNNQGMLINIVYVTID